MYSKVFLIFPIVALACVFGRPRGSTSYFSVKNHVDPDGSYEEYDDERVRYNEYDRNEDFENDHYEKYPYHHPNYIYKYGVDDKYNKDFKTQQEYREGDVVKGSYSVLQPDGKTRIVHYTADEKNGFKAEVVYENGQDSEEFD